MLDDGGCGEADELVEKQETPVFRVEVDSLRDYLDFDPNRRGDLQKLDKLIRRSAPGLKRYFHRGTPAGEPGMRFRMIGYGKLEYLARSGESVEWPAVGVALQKNYISVYFSVTKAGASLLASYAGRLGAVKARPNNFSFRSYEDLDARGLATLFAEAEQIFLADSRRCVLGHGGAKPLSTRR